MVHHLMRMMATALLCATTLGSAQCVAAAVSLKDYAQAKDSDAFRQYLAGVVDGFRQANAELQLRRLKKLYCEPANASLGFDGFTGLIEKEVKENEAYYTVESPVQTPLLFGLMKAYPCK